ncbi:NUDIX domain-containing protein [Candidatus Pacearchaeota archaeon]|nr:NUDIX domain-containing protein [Candidatus Pacearchaeota archaeon]
MTGRPSLTVGAIIRNHEEKILLLKSPKWQGKYIFPCGHVESKERLEDALRREVREETGLEIYDIEFLRPYEYINPLEFHKPEIHCVGLQYICRTHNKDVRLNNEADDYYWASPHEALQLNVETSTKETIEYYIKAA